MVVTLVPNPFGAHDACARAIVMITPHVVVIVNGWGTMMAIDLRAIVRAWINLDTTRADLDVLRPCGRWDHQSNEAGNWQNSHVWFCLS